MTFDIITAQARPEFLDVAEAIILPAWPDFMHHDPVANRHWRGLHEQFGALQFALVERGCDRFLVVGNSIPLAWQGAASDLPDEGWDWAVTQGFADHAAGRRPTVLCALSIVVAADSRGQGLSAHAVRAMKCIARAGGFSDLFVPARPTWKCRYPLDPHGTLPPVDERGRPFL